MTETRTVPFAFQSGATEILCFRIDEVGEKDAYIAIVDWWLLDGICTKREAEEAMDLVENLCREARKA